MPRKRASSEVSATRSRRPRARGLVTTNRELSLQLRALRDNQKALERYLDLFDFAPVTYVLLDPAGMVLQINLAGCRLLNVERARLIGHPLLVFAIRQDRQAFLDHLRRCRSGSGTVESEIRFESQDRRTVACHLYSKRTSYNEGEAFPTVIVDQTAHLALELARLIAERRSAQAERDSEIAREASDAKDRFLATVSHELRTPLTPALFAASHLASLQDLPGEVQMLAATIKRNIEFEVHLIDDLLDVARINRDRISLRLDTVDVHDVLREAVGICDAFAEEKHVAVAQHLLAPAHYVSADRARLRQVFWNLLNNAIKFTEPGGSILIRSANVSDDHLRISIRDSGMGMGSKAVETIFAPFDRRSVKRESRGGLGLGLTICKGIIGAHGGQIWAISDGPGRGSTFAIELATVAAPPTDEAESPRSSAATEPPKTPRLHRLLLIEDDVDSGEMLALFLSNHGYEVEIASSFRDAVRRLNDDWDIVLSDIGLPDGSGLDIARRARRVPHPPQRLIALTGYGSTDDIRASREAGFDDHVVKPIDFERLLKSLSEASAQPEYR
jgi:PAS domain S-box-containing protein